MQKAVIYDVDGTLADVTGVRHYVTADPRRKNFHAFHAAASFVHPHHDVVRAAHWTHSMGLTNLVVTSRKEMWRFRTSTWLQKWEVPFDGLLMRADSDDRRDREVKKDILDRIRQRFEVVLAFDDNPKVVELWRDEDIPVVVVPGWIH
jgi:phosphoglycolate phosphatase-like HAD superfamily hydrolase